MPPVREPSTKPSAATVLPAPVACSNQKRRAAPGSSGCSGSWSSSSSPAAVRLRGAPASPRPRLARPRRPRRPRPRLVVVVVDVLDSSSSSSASSSLVVLVRLRAASVAVLALGLGDQRRERAGQHVDLVRGQHGAVGELRLVLGQQALEAEHQRVLLAPLDAGLLAAGLDLRERGVECTPAGGARPQGVRIRRERLAREPLDAVELIAGWNGRSLAGHFGGVSHFEACRNTGRRHTHDGGATLVPGLQPTRASLSAAAPRPAG